MYKSSSYLVLWVINIHEEHTPVQIVPSKRTLITVFGISCKQISQYIYIKWDFWAINVHEDHTPVQIVPSKRTLITVFGITVNKFHNIKWDFCQFGMIQAFRDPNGYGASCHAHSIYKQIRQLTNTKQMVIERAVSAYWSSVSTTFISLILFIHL